MLTADLVKPRLRARGQHLHIEMLDPQHGFWQTCADELITLFQAHAGQTQGDWETALFDYEGDRTDYEIIRGLAKVLSDAATFERIETPIEPDVLRQRLFSTGPVFGKPDLFHPESRNTVLQQVADEFEMTVEQVETALFADRTSQYRITDVGTEWTAVDLIQRYNLELARAALYWSSEMTIEIHDSFKDFWKYLKLFKLMFEASPIDKGYRVQLDGPISPFVQSTTRYGRQFAAFLPALFLCERWQMQADVRPPQIGKHLLYQLNDQIPLVSHFKKSPDYDSQLEANFATEFYAKFGDKRGKWELSREDEVILLGDTVMVPDFALTYRDTGQRILIEIMGFWHPDYLRRKLKKVHDAHLDNLLLLVYEDVNLTADKLEDVPATVLYFVKKPVLKDVLAAADDLHQTLIGEADIE